MPRVLCIITEGFEEIETLAPIDLLRRAGVEVTLAALGETMHVTGRSALTIHADMPLSGVTEPDGFDLLLLPGGPQVTALRQDGRAAALAKSYANAGKPVAAICAAPLVLKDAGLLQGRRFTSHSGTAGELPARILDEAVVQDGLLITSQGAGTSIAFGLALVRLLAGEESERSVRQGMMLG